MGRYYGAGKTNNEAEMFALRDAMSTLAQLLPNRPDLHLPVQIFGDSQLIIRSATRVFKKPSRHSIHWALQQTRQLESQFKGPNGL